MEGGNRKKETEMAVDGGENVGGNRKTAEGTEAIPEKSKKFLSNRVFTLHLRTTFPKPRPYPP